MSSSHHCRQEDNVRLVHPGSRCRWSCRSSSTHHELCEQDETNPIEGEKHWAFRSLQVNEKPFCKVWRFNAGKVKMYLQAILQHAAGSNCHPQTLKGPHHSLDNMRGRFEDIWPNIVEQMIERIFTAKAIHSQRHMLHHSTGCLPVYKIPVMESKYRVIEACWKQSACFKC